MSDDEVAESSGIDKFSPSATKLVAERVGPILRKWFRAKVHGLDWFPTEGGALVVSNHSGGMLTPDVILFGSAFYRVLIPPNLPLPTKIVTQVLEPIDVAEQFGPDPDVDEVDAHVRHVMQAALNELSRKRRFPVLG
jgi:1-acyl-sn-glycerol-3-phosphate acyltransferase